MLANSLWFASNQNLLSTGSEKNIFNLNNNLQSNSYKMAYNQGGENPKQSDDMAYKLLDEQFPMREDFCSDDTNQLQARNQKEYIEKFQQKYYFERYGDYIIFNRGDLGKSVIQKSKVWAIAIVSKIEEETKEVIDLYWLIWHRGQNDLSTILPMDNYVKNNEYLMEFFEGLTEFQWSKLSAAVMSQKTDIHYCYVDEQLKDSMPDTEPEIFDLPEDYKEKYRKLEEESRQKAAQIKQSDLQGEQGQGCGKESCGCSESSQIDDNQLSDNFEEIHKQQSALYNRQQSVNNNEHLQKQGNLQEQHECCGGGGCGGKGRNRHDHHHDHNHGHHHDHDHTHQHHGHCDHQHNHQEHHGHCNHQHNHQEHHGHGNCNNHDHNQPTKPFYTHGRNYINPEEFYTHGKNYIKPEGFNFVDPFGDKNSQNFGFNQVSDVEGVSKKNQDQSSISEEFQQYQSMQQQQDNDNGVKFQDNNKQQQGLQQNNSNQVDLQNQQQQGCCGRCNQFFYYYQQPPMWMYANQYQGCCRMPMAQPQFSQGGCYGKCHGTYISQWSQGGCCGRCHGAPMQQYGYCNRCNGSQQWPSGGCCKCGGGRNNFNNYNSQNCCGKCGGQQQAWQGHNCCKSVNGYNHYGHHGYQNQGFKQGHSSHSCCDGSGYRQSHGEQFGKGGSQGSCCNKQYEDY